MSNTPDNSSTPGPGTKEIALTDEQLNALVYYCRLQCPFEDICALLEIEKVTLTQLLRQDPRLRAKMDRAYATGKINLRRALIEKAESDHKAQIFLAKKTLGFNQPTTGVKSRKERDELDRRTAELMFKYQDTLREAYEKGLAADAAETSEETDE
jgi:hypothetical protein